MTSPWGDPNAGWNTGPVDYFDNNAAQNHLLIFVAQDAPEYFRTSNNPDGMVHPTRGATWSPFPNTVVRGLIADLDVPAEDGSRGKIYQGAVIFPSSLVRTMKKWPGTPPKLLKWWKTGPKQTDPYELVNMAGDQNAVAVADEFLARHPEFLTLPAPDPYDGKAPDPQQYPPQGYPPYPPQGYGPPPQGYGPQPGYGPPAGPPQGYQDPWAQRPPQPPQQGWGQDQGYNQHPPRQPQQGGSFLDQFQQGGLNHHGQPQAPQPGW
jgi:hypothetical protein